MHREVNLTKRVKTQNGVRYCPVVLSANGRAKPDYVYVFVDGKKKEERHPKGAYYIEWRENGKRRRLSVGDNPGEATAQRLRKEAELNARNHGVAVAATSTNGKRSLAGAMAEYLEQIELSKKPKTYAAYSTALAYFQECCAKLNLEDLEKKDLLKYAAFLRGEKDQSARSVANKFGNLMVFLKSQGIRGLVGKNDWPQFTEEEPEIYEKEDLETLFAARDDEERLWFDFFLITGMREQEVMHTYWTDVNMKANTVRVAHKPDRGWEPKRYKEREIPIPPKLVESLRAWKAKLDTKCPLVFATKGCNVKRDFLDCLKRVAERAKLNKDDFWLHKFRATFATWALWAGVDFRTVQAWMGHEDIESTMRYLKPNRSQQVRNKVNEIFA